MLSSSQRLRAKEVVEVLKKGRGLGGGKYISAKVFYPRGEKTQRSNATIRASVVVSKKVAGTNVARNRVRRLVYAAAQEILKEIQNENKKMAHVVLFINTLPDHDQKTLFKADVAGVFSQLA